MPCPCPFYTNLKQKQSQIKGLVLTTTAGFGSDEPRLVEGDGLEGVRAVALGGWHVLVLTE